MEKSSDTRQDPGSVSPKDQLFGRSRPSKRAQVTVVGFGLLVVASLVVPALSAAVPAPDFTLIAMGLMLGMGVAELLDPTLRRLAVALRFAGMGIAVFGAVLGYWV